MKKYKQLHVKHPNIHLLFCEGYFGFFLLIHIPLLFFVLYTKEFPNFLGTMDIVVITLALFQLTLVKPLMYKGIIKGYYRKNYRTYKKGFLLSFICTGVLFGAILRQVVLIVNFTLQYFTFDKNEIPKLLADMKLNYMDVKGATIGIILYLLYVFWVYYKDRFITIEDFSNHSLYYINQYGWDIKTAVEKVLHDQEVRKNANLEFEIVSETCKESSYVQEMNDRTTIDPMRRHARNEHI